MANPAFGEEYTVLENLSREAVEGLRLYKRLGDALAALDLWDLANEYVDARNMRLRPSGHRRKLVRAVRSGGS